MRIGQVMRAALLKTYTLVHLSLSLSFSLFLARSLFVSLALPPYLLLPSKASWAYTGFTYIKLVAFTFCRVFRIAFPLCVKNSSPAPQCANSTAKLSGHMNGTYHISFV